MARRRSWRAPWGQVLMLPLLTVAMAAAWADGPVRDDERRLEQRFQALSAQLRCVVCQNQSLADSPADLATDLKQLLRERLQAGATDEAVLDDMVARYGEAVLYRPRLHPSTGLLWFGPGLLLVGGLLWLARQWRGGRVAPVGEEPQP